MDIRPEPEWESLYDELARRRGAALFLGRTDTGKSTLVRYLLKRFVTEGINVSLIDSDIGQSSLGLPGTISMKVFRDEREIEEFRWEHMSFLGTVNPANAVSRIIRTAERMACLCREETDVMLADTTGLVTGAIGRLLKTGKIKAVNPEFVVAVQKKDELEHLLSLIGGRRILRMRSSPEAKSRSRAVRFRYRNRILKKYFSADAISEIVLHINEMRFYYHGRSVIPGEADIRERMIVGLNHEEDTLALGFAAASQAGTVTIRSPLESPEKINAVILGDMILPLII